MSDRPMSSAQALVLFAIIKRGGVAFLSWPSKRTVAAMERTGLIEPSRGRQLRITTRGREEYARREARRISAVSRHG